MDLVIGGGVGGLSAAIRLAMRGRRVRLYEASPRLGGLAGGVELDGEVHDGGPYILLDRPGLSFAFERLGIRLDDELDLIPLARVYRVERPDAPAITLHADAERTAAGLEADFPGAAAPYLDFVRRTTAIYERLQPLQRLRPDPLQLLKRGLFREIPFLLRGLKAHLDRSGLPGPVADAVGIWTHIAGQPLSKAPAPLAFVPALVHRFGAYTVKGGIRRIPEVLEARARAMGVELRTGQAVDRIVRDGRRVLGVEVGGERVPAERVVSDTGLSTYLRLLDPPDPHLAAHYGALPLQSPGVAAWLRVDAEPDLPFLRFWLPPGEPTRLLVHPGAVDPARRGQARLVCPMAHEHAEQLGEEGQRAHLDRLIEEPWWRQGVRSARVLHTRVPVEWGRRHLLWRDAMNPAMTAAFMRSGRVPHQSPVCDNLFLAGSATHPGQWVSFCAISGILAAEAG